MNRAMRISFTTGIILLIIKTYAYLITGSSAILSDCSESVIHVFAVGFATYSMWLSHQPADKNHQYGHDKISFFSAGFEGAMIAFAALYILYESTLQLIHGVTLTNLSDGIFFIAAATLVNGLLGSWLLMKGKRYQSIILSANGKHLLTDCVTSSAVVLGLFAVNATDMLWLDPIIAIGAACNILYSGIKLVKVSIGGLMDESDETVDRELRSLLSSITDKKGLSYHCLRHRRSGRTIFIEFHLLFPDEAPLMEAHEAATEIESKIKNKLQNYTLDITTHLEPKEHHDQTHIKFQTGI